VPSYCVCVFFGCGGGVNFNGTLTVPVTVILSKLLCNYVVTRNFICFSSHPRGGTKNTQKQVMKKCSCCPFHFVVLYFCNGCRVRVGHGPV